ncbi:MAG: hypothetical protein U0326_03640 [Polyangiales bacterium]
MRSVTRALSCLGMVLTVSCSVGDGVGAVRGRLMVEACSLDVPRYSMQPGFFGGEWHQGSFTIQIAPGGDTGEYADELVFLVDDTGYVARHLNERIEVGAAGVAPVHAVLRLTKSCGRRELVQTSPNVALEAWRGYAVFESIYRGDPTADASARRTAVTSFSLELSDPRAVRDYTNSAGTRAVGEGREPAPVSQSRAELEGNFEFYFVRGRPAQRFQ